MKLRSAGVNAAGVVLKIGAKTVASRVKSIVAGWSTQINFDGQSIFISGTLKPNGTVMNSGSCWRLGATFHLVPTSHLVDDSAGTWVSQ